MSILNDPREQVAPEYQRFLERERGQLSLPLEGERSKIIFRNVEPKNLPAAMSAASYAREAMPGKDAIVGRGGVYFYVKRNKRSVSVTQED